MNLNKEVEILNKLQDISKLLANADFDLIEQTIAQFKIILIPHLAREVDNVSNERMESFINSYGNFPNMWWEVQKDRNLN